ncbi:hypothetical protein BDD43_5169 [Mucilaginibacter gracilis]|uniref:Cell division protein FtsL n=1 Tax=Mucilaginibacter gracilis TaxID=423350 RepID=A0A495J7E2_9SPHI|nr:hypothetical protein [Mucilaginibacter gracilis]RKR84916.1 hypothetical protein BDD43_5169 [Mucilaginibacter gracilis]
MTTIETREIRGITLRILYLLVAFSVVSTAGIMTSYFGLKNDSQLLANQIEILKIQYKIIDQRLEKMENKKDTERLKNTPENHATNQKNLSANSLFADAHWLPNPQNSNN